MEFRDFSSDSEWADGLVLWEKVFGVGPWLFHSLHRAHEDRQLADCSGAWSGEELVSAVDFFIRHTWTSGGLRRMGGIGSVATHPEFRRLGLSGKLLEMALAKMESRACDWSVLFTGVNDHYARYGWRNTPLVQDRVELVESGLDLPSGWSIERKSYFHPGEERVLAPLHSGTYEGRPLVHRRTDWYWRTAVRERLNRPNREAVLALFEGAVRGYVVMDTYDQWFELHELAGDEEAMGAAMRGAAARALETGCRSGAFAFAEDLRRHPEVRKVVDSSTTEELPYAMSRVIADRLAWEELESSFADPRAVHLRLDDF